jgi:hypothetical protein
MKSINHLQYYPAGISIAADDIVEFHASRLILLIRLCGTKDRMKKQYKIEGLTKIAKLDFFIRYPEFFRRVVNYLNKESQVPSHLGGVESRMIRYHYGPWDERYYQVLPFLESKGLLKIEKDRNSYNFYLTDLGYQTAEKLLEDEEFVALGKNITNVNNILSNYSGSQLKSLVYKLFEKEVSDKKFGELIL